MRLCPKDQKPCWDDLCYGSGCMQMDGYEMLEACAICGGYVDHEFSECSTCTCDEADDEH